MNKQAFLDALHKGLSGLPKDDAEERLTFYSDMIDDGMEEGLSEEDAVSALGDLDNLIRQIKADIPLSKLIKEKVSQKKQLKAWEIVLLALGSPIWISLLIASFAVVFSLYVALWSVVISLWAIFASLIGCAIGGIVAGSIFAVIGHPLTGIATIGAGIVCAGLSVFMFFGCKATTTGNLLLTKKIATWIKNCLISKEAAS